MSVTQPKILPCMSHHPVFSNVSHTTQNSPGYVTSPNYLRCMSHSPEFSNVCHTAQVFVPDEKFSSVTMMWSWSCSLCVVFKTFSYLLNQTSEVHETLPVLFLCQWELVYQFSEKFIDIYYPLPIIFVVIYYWT